MKSQIPITCYGLGVGVVNGDRVGIDRKWGVGSGEGGVGMSKQTELG